MLFDKQRSTVLNQYECGLCLLFNPSKTVCMIGGQNPFLSILVWTINDVQLAVSDNVKYLGSTPSTANSSVHIDGRIKAAQNAYYALQGGGLKFNTVSPKTALNVYNTAVKSVLLFGCNAVHLNSGHLSKLKKNTK